jgi:type IV pilus assembly protein PilZ
MSIERRISPRIPVSLQVEYRSEGELRHDLVTDSSEGGLFIRTSRPLPIGTDLELVILLPEAAPIRLKARVVWERLLGKGPEAPGMGVRLLEPLDPRRLTKASKPPR